MLIDERFAFITQGEARYQVLKYDPETGEPYDWDEAATHDLVKETEFFQSPPSPPTIPVPVRQRVTKAALKLAAAQANLLGPVNDFIAQLPFDAPAAILWAEAFDFKRSDPIWDAFAPQIGVTPADIDALFNAAGALDDYFGGDWFR